MSKITLDNLSNNLKDYLENVGSIDPSVYQEKTDETLQTEDKTIVGAINELFQNANSGKQLIASAIGEPLSSEDTFSAMSDKINDMKSDLKQVLTDEGVSVSEEDDMASLITKVDEEFDKQVVPAGDAVASDVLSGKTFMNNSGELLTGNVTKMSEYTQITSGNVNNNGAAVYISIPSGAYTTPSVLGKPEIFLTYADLDANLAPENIVSGKSICGVTGTAKTVPTIVSGTTNTIYTSEVKQYSSGIYSDSSNTWSTSWYINTSRFDQLYMNYSNIKNVSITFQYMCDVGNIYAYCSNVILTKGYSTIATLCTSNCYIDDGGYWYNNVDPTTVTLDQLNGATVQLSGAYCTSQPTYIVQVRYVIRGDIQ